MASHGRTGIPGWWYGSQTRDVLTRFASQAYRRPATPAEIDRLAMLVEAAEAKGEKWEAADVISDPTLPRKRLIWGATDGENYVVHYERGGRAHSFHVLVASFKKGDTKPKQTWRGIGDRLKDYAAFLDALRSGKLDDRLDYAH